LDVKLSTDDIKSLEEPYKPHRIIGPLPIPESAQP
jgi:hypothetical protein